MYATASSEDIPLLRMNRWRVIADRGICTTTAEDGYEVLIDLANVLCRKARWERVTRLSDNWLDFRRDRLKPTVARYNNIWEEHGGVSYVFMNNGYLVQVDTEDRPRLEPLNWHIVTKNGSMFIKAKTMNKGRERMVLMPRIIQSIHLEDASTRVEFINGNRLDCRKDNLITQPRKGDYEPLTENNSGITSIPQSSSV